MPKARMDLIFIGLLAADGLDQGRCESFGLVCETLSILGGIVNELQGRVIRGNFG